LDGETVQHVEYVPFSEVFIEERNNVWNTPYLFSTKELDEETGLYYYGARYYDARSSVWLSADTRSDTIFVKILKKSVKLFCGGVPMPTPKAKYFL
jgi:RHS repeat-associated protein